MILVDGVTGSGKSTLAEMIRKNYADSVFVGSKFTERTRRITDSDWEFRFVDNIPAEFKEYTFNTLGKRYAIDLAELTNVMSRGQAYLVTCSDLGIIALLKQRYETVVIFVYRPTTVEDITDLMKRRGVESQEDISNRCREVGDVLKIYCENMSLYDFVILNAGTVNDLEIQISRIFEQLGLSYAVRADPRKKDSC